MKERRITVTTKSKQRIAFESTYSYRELVNKHSLDTEGLWKILGEDPNCDFAGHHYQPDLGLYQGKLDDIINYAVSLKSFFTWGAGGDIRLVSTPVKITATSNAERIALERKLEEAEQVVESLKNQLSKL